MSAYCDFCFFESPHPENHMCECPCAGCDPPESEPSEGAVAREHLETYAQGALTVLLKQRPKRGATEHGTPFKEKPIEET